MNNDDIIQSTKSVLQGLDALKIEHEKILENLLANKIEEKLDLFKKSMDMINLGINEGQIMMQLIHYLENFEGEKHKLHTQIKRLCQENAWLRDELGSTQRKFHECKQINTTYINEFDDLKFLKDTQQIDNNEQILTDIDLMNELFPSDDEQEYPEQFHIHINSLTSSSSATNGDNHEVPERLKTLHNLVVQYASQGRYEVAVPLCRQALEDLEKTSGHQHPDVATMLNILALVYRDQSKFKEAITLLNDALSIREKTLGLNHPAVAVTLNNLAVLYGKRHKFQEAESLCKRALEIREKYFGLSHPDVAKQLNNLALIGQNQGKYNEVELYYQRAIDIYIQNFDIHHPNVIKTKNNLALIYLQQEKYSQAEELYRNILIEMKDNDFQGNSYKTIRVDIPTVTTISKNLSILYRRQNRYDAADSIDKCILNTHNDLQAIIQVLDIINMSSISDDAWTKKRMC